MSGRADDVGFWGQSRHAIQAEPLLLLTDSVEKVARDYRRIMIPFR
jgi:hypothetical protein